LEIFAVWHGGMAFIWWLIGVLIAVFIFVKVKKLSVDDFMLLLWLLCVIAPFAIMLWRFWNYLNQELYGIVIPQSFLSAHASLSNFFSNINIFHVYDQVDQNLRLNTNFLAIIFEGLIPFVVGVILFASQLKKREYKHYLNMWIFVILYSIARFLLEYFRVWSQTQYIWCFTKSQWIFIMFFVFWVYMLCIHKKKIVKL
jgi:phosphatidylglycerol:prolipoprotein diacylglycerol transferase